MRKLTDAVDYFLEYNEKVEKIETALKEQQQRNNQMYQEEYAREENERLEGIAEGRKEALYTKMAENVNYLCDFKEREARSKFSDTITPDDNATLDALATIDLTQAEFDEYAKKYKNNSLALRKLWKIAESKKMKSGSTGLTLDFYLHKIHITRANMENIKNLDEHERWTVPMAMTMLRNNLAEFEAPNVNEIRGQRGSNVNDHTAAINAKIGNG